MVAASVAGHPLHGCRPADVFVPMPQAAFDLAVSSGMRGAALTTSATDCGRAVGDYELWICQYRNTRRQCSDQGLQFGPLVAEACAGGWGAQANRVWRHLGGLLASRFAT